MYYAIFSWSAPYEGENVVAISFPKWNQQIKSVALRMMQKDCMFFECVAVIHGELLENHYIYQSPAEYVGERLDLKEYVEELNSLCKN